ncbi:MAG: hypothetical protein J5840_06490 [Lachnospiraceae bacterium]|nr:hypothetical protein [Lachnospiraceae bacterium]
MNNVLKMSTPIISSFPVYGDLFSILEQNDFVKSWMCNNFIQLKHVEPVIFFDSYRSIIYNCPHVATSCITRDLLRKCWYGDFNKLIKQMIDSERYVFLNADRKYIQSFKTQKSKEHELFIYGYDDSREVYYCADNVDGGKYTTFTAPMAEVEQAYWNVKENNFDSALHCISVIKSPAENNWFEWIRMDHIYELFSAYAESRPVLNFAERYVVEASGFCLHQYAIDKITPEREYLDWRDFSIIHEHKKMMVFRLEFIGETLSTDDFKEYLEVYKDLEKRYKIILFMMIKYNMNHDKKLIPQIISNADEAVKLESSVLNSLKELFYKYTLNN